VVIIVPLQGLFASAFLSRAVPIAASVVVHASLATSLVLGAAGHARAGVAPTSIEIDVDVTPETPAAPPREEQEEAPAQPAKAAAAMPPTHHHDYPVPPSHDATPHDPNLVHDHADAHDHDAPAQAAPALAADSVMPRFTIASGASSHPIGGAVSASGSGNGGASSEAPAAPIETLPVSAVSVPATLAAAAVAAYPPAARSDDREGDVGLEIVVDGDGRVLDAHLTRPAGHGFDESALEAIRRYRFAPAKKDGRAVRVRMPWIVQFRLR
jgi:TonB family protein